MGQITLSDETLRKLREIAERKDKSVEELLDDFADTLAREEHGASTRERSDDPLLALAGQFDFGTTDIVSEMDEIRRQHYQKRFGK